MNKLLYRERHAMPKFIWVLLIPITLMFWVFAFIQLVLGKQVGTNPMSDAGLVVFTIVFGVVFPLFFGFLRGEVNVYSDVIHTALRPIYKKRIPIQDIRAVKLLDVRALREFGGWGIRWNGAKWGLIMEGNKGVEITTKNNQVYVISSKDASALYQVLNQNLV